MKSVIKKPLLFFFIITLLIPVRISAQSKDDCLMCHSDSELTTEREGKEVSLFVDESILAKSPHSKLNCISCHIGFNLDDLPHKENITPINCLHCHKNAPVKHSFHPQMLKSSSTDYAGDTSCKNCHGKHDIISLKVKGSKWNRSNLTQSCGSCHKENKEVYQNSQHNRAFEQKIKGAPDCLTCHKSNLGRISSGDDFVELKLRQEKLCLSCHLDKPEIRSRTSPSAGFINAYEHSVHGVALLKGNGKAANCVDCHTSHEVQSGSDSRSTVFKTNVPQTCSKCHEEIFREYEESTHGISVRKGNMDAPVCTECHGEHNILKHTDPQSPVATKNVSTLVCSPCHNSLKLTDKYELSANRFTTFEDTYHGLALKGGSTEVANCASCHGVHNIKSSSDPSSTIHKSNLIKTCGKCHPGANANFTIGKIHVDIKEKSEEPILYFIANTYIIMIFTIVGGMFIHNFLDFIKKSKIKKLKQRGKIITEHHGHSLYLRMNLNERIQHGTLAVSFIILVITGFMLRFPDSWWVSHIRDLSEDAFTFRSLLHRIAAVVIVSISFYHIVYVGFIPRGRQLIKDLFPRYQDLKDALAVAKFNLGLLKNKPKLDRFSYIEKAEYWALIWGTIVMALTGFIMWFDNTFIGIFTKLGYEISRTIHYYEAWLAFLSILVWHFYFVIFNPEIYPMSIAWLKGTISEEEMVEDHPLELERIKKQEHKSFESDNSDKKEISKNNSSAEG